MSVQSAVLSAVRLGLKTLEVFSLKKACDFACHLWLRPIRIPRRSSDQAVHDRAQRFHVEVRSVRYEVESWGQGPVVLLVHGWDGRGSQFYKFVEPLVAAGYRVVTFDMPASGSAPGNQVDPGLAGAVVQAVAARCGGISALVAHSFGSSWAMVGIVAGGLALKRMVLISPPLSLRKIFEKFCRRLTISKRLRTRLETRFVEIHGDLWTNYSNDALVKKLGAAKGLIIHDQDDREVPVDEGRALSRLWPGSEFVETTRLGHYRVLREDAVISRTVDFLKPALA